MTIFGWPPYSRFHHLYEGILRISWRLLSETDLIVFLPIHMSFFVSLLVVYFRVRWIVLTSGAIQHHESALPQYILHFTAYYWIIGVWIHVLVPWTLLTSSWCVFRGKPLGSSFAAVLDKTRSHLHIFSRTMGMFWWFNNCVIECHLVKGDVVTLFCWNVWTAALRIFCRICMWY